MSYDIPEKFSKMLKYNVGHTAGIRGGSKTASRQYSNEKGTTVASQIYGHTLDKKYHTRGALEH